MRAKYVGTIEVPEPRGSAMCITAISRVRAQHKLSKESKPKMRFNISTQGIRIYDVVSGLCKDTYPLRRISYITLLPSNKKVFAFITVKSFSSWRCVWAAWEAARQDCSRRRLLRLRHES